MAFVRPHILDNLGTHALFRKITWREVRTILKDAAASWWGDKAPRLGAAVAYYAVFSLAPLLVIVVSLAGMAFGREAAENRVLYEIGGVVGYDVARAVQAILLSGGGATGGSIAATITGALVLLMGSLGVFVELQDALNTIWRVTPRPGRAVVLILRERWVSFSMVLSIGFLLLTSLVLSAGMAALSEYFKLLQIVQMVDAGVSFFTTTLLCALIFKILPDVRIPWSNVWMGAVVTSLLFNLGRLLISLYLAHSNVISIWGAAASVVALLLWVYFSAQVLFFGAEFVRAYCAYHGCKIRPKKNAVPNKTLSPAVRR